MTDENDDGPDPSCSSLLDDTDLILRTDYIPARRSWMFSIMFGHAILRPEMAARVIDITYP